MEGLQNAVSDDAVKARLKWFNVPKGFGFVVPENGNYDAFLHISTLKQAGVEKLGEGARLLCRIERDSTRARVTEVVAILDAGELRKNPDQSFVPETSGDDCCHLTGTVKWYNPGKGFGFVLADDGLKDAFLHKNCLERYGLATIEPGAPIEMNVRATRRGREVVDFVFLDEQG